MIESDGVRAFATLLKDGCTKIFFKRWPAWLGGLLIGITSVITFAWQRPWGIVGGVREWIDWSLYHLGLFDSHPYYSPLLSGSSVLTFGLLWGAFASALFSRKFSLKIAPPFEMLRGAIGGVLMGIGTAMAPAFWSGSFAGGVVFGFGMPFAGGCGSGVCWRSAEGGVKQIIAVLFLAVSNSLSQALLDSSESLSSAMGMRVYLPHHLSYLWSVVVVAVVMILYYLVCSWNEKTRAFV